MAAPATIASNQPLGGTTFITINGVTFLLGDDFEWSPSTSERATAKGLSGIYGYTETPRPGHMKGTAYDYAGNSITDIGNLTDTDALAQLRNGKTVALNHGWNVEPPVVNAAAGTFTFNFESGDVQELSK
jgi:hypothetical protein